MIRLSLDSQQFFSKPTTHDAATLSSRIASKDCLISFDDFVDAISSGQTYCPGVFLNSQRKASQWVSQQIFTADIDDYNRSYQNITESCDGFASKYGVFPSVIHESFSSTADQRKWRVVFISNKLIEDASTALAILKMIQTHFKSDRAIVDLARLLYGTTSDKLHYKSSTNCFNHGEIDGLQKYKPVRIAEAERECTQEKANFSELTFDEKIRARNLLLHQKSYLKNDNQSRYVRLKLFGVNLATLGYLSWDMAEALAVDLIKEDLELTKIYITSYDKSYLDIIYANFNWKRNQL